MEVSIGYLTGNSSTKKIYLPGSSDPFDFKDDSKLTLEDKTNRILLDNKVIFDPKTCSENERTPVVILVVGNIESDGITVKSMTGTTYHGFNSNFSSSYNFFGSPSSVSYSSTVSNFFYNLIKKIFMPSHSVSISNCTFTGTGSSSSSSTSCFIGVTGNVQGTVENEIGKISIVGSVTGDVTNQTGDIYVKKNVEGNVSTTIGDISINGNCEEASTVNGDITASEIGGNVSNTNGGILASQIKRGVSTVMGDIKGNDSHTKKRKKQNKYEENKKKKKTS